MLWCRLPRCAACWVVEVIRIVFWTTIVAAFVMILSAAWAHAPARDKVLRPPAWACLLIRQEAMRFDSREAAIRAARDRGYTAEDIARAKLCF